MVTKIMNQAYLIVMIYRGNFKRWATTLFSFIRAVTLNVSYELVHQEEEAGFCKNGPCREGLFILLRDNAIGNVGTVCDARR